MSQATDRQNAVTDAAEVIAEYLHSYDMAVTKAFMEEVNLAVLMRLTTLATEAAEELDEKADREGARY